MIVEKQLKNALKSNKSLTKYGYKNKLRIET